MSSRNVLFIHDGDLYQDPEGKLYGIHYTPEIQRRYRQLGENLRFLMRIYPIKQAEAVHFQALEEGHFSARALPSVHSPLLWWKNHAAFEAILEEEIRKANIIVLRLPSVAGRQAARLAKKHNKPVLTELVSCVWDALWNNRWLGKLLAPLRYWQYKTLIRESEWVLYVTQSFLQGRYPCQNHTLACSDLEIRLQETSWIEEKAEQVLRLLPTDRIRFITIGSTDAPYKRHKDVLNALINCNTLPYAWEWHIVGQGDGQKLRRLALEKGIQERVFFHGICSKEEVERLLQQSHLMLHASVQEGLPRVVVEAMNQGCAVWAAKTGGVPELLSQEAIFEKKQVKQLQNLLENLSPEVLSKQIVLNFERLRAYAPEVLEVERAAFYRKFIQNAENKLNA